LCHDGKKCAPDFASLAGARIPSFGRRSLGEGVPCTPAAPCGRAGRGVTAFWLKYQDRDRMLRRVTQPPHIAGPLGGTRIITIYNGNTRNESL